MRVLLLIALLASCRPGGLQPNTDTSDWEGLDRSAVSCTASEGYGTHCICIGAEKRYQCVRDLHGQRWRCAEIRPLP